MERIEAELLIPGGGEPVSNGVVIIDNSAISYAGLASQAPATPGAVVHKAGTVMPGMWDCHGHFLGLRTLDLGLLPLDPVPLRAARCARDLAAALRRRDHLGPRGRRPGRAPRQGGRRGRARGPGHLCRRGDPEHHGGHADLHSYPLPWMGDFAVHYGELRLADGPAECMRAVREQLRQNAG